MLRAKARVTGPPAGRPSGAARWRRWGAAATLGVLAAGLVQVPAAAVDRDTRRPESQKTASVPVKPQGLRPAAAPKHAEWKPRAAWPEAASAEVAVAPAGRRGDPQKVGSLPVRVVAPQGRAGLTPAQVPAKVRVEVLDRETADRVGVAGLPMRISRADGGAAAGTVGLEVDLSAFADSFGADWTTRARFVTTPTCDGEECGNTTLLPTSSDDGARLLRAEVPAIPAARRGAADEPLLAIAGGASGQGGTFQATSLSPAGSWQVSGNSGAFNWSYPLRMPPALAGPAPELSLQYNSGTTDGRTGATNAQPSVVGEGFDFAGAGFIERSYRSCLDDGHKDPEPVADPKKRKSRYDLCWPGKGDHLTMSFGGRNGELVRSGTDQWRLKSDDGTRIERRRGAPNGDDDGEYFVVTTTDGTRHHFGRTKRTDADGEGTDSTLTVPVFGDDEGEPCHKAEFKDAHCRQGWRWNLDYTVDVHGNSMTYYYNKETNKYAAAADDAKVMEYDRGSFLERIEYGGREGGEAAAPAPMRVVFGVDARCKPMSSPKVTCKEGLNPTTAVAWRDVPHDQICAPRADDKKPKCKGQWSPTFFTRVRMSRITTQIHVGGAYQDVDTWNLAHDFPDAGEESPALWLDSVTHTGGSGKDAITLPPTVFGKGVALPNRVNEKNSLPFRKFRLSAIQTESGGVVDVRYSEPSCPAARPAPQSNRALCFPSYWRKDADNGKEDWFHKYVVRSVREDSRIGLESDQKLTSYEYATPAWRYDDGELQKADTKTWGQFRGFEKVTTTTGAPSDPLRLRAEAAFLQGMHGDREDRGGGRKQVVRTTEDGVRVTDHDRLQGFVLSQRQWDETGKEVNATLHTPWLSAPTATEGDDEARLTQPGTTKSRTRLDSGTRWTGIVHHYDAHGMVDRSDDQGDLGPDGRNTGAAAADDSCTDYSYARNTDRNLLTLLSRVTTTSRPCTGARARLAADTVVSDVVTRYAGGDKPANGDVVATEELSGFRDGAPTHVAVSRSTYDEYGRVLTSTDVKGRKTTTAYRHERPGGVVVGMTVRDAKDHVTSSKVAPAFGEVVETVDPNNARTKMELDALGRLRKVWLPDRAEDLLPNHEYQYQVRNDDVSTVATRSLSGGGVTTTYEIHDPLLRPLQTQRQTRFGRLITDTTYDARGLAVRRVGPFFNDRAPDGKLVDVADSGANAPQTTTTYDGAGRATAETFRAPGKEWTTTTSHHGDHTVVTPPAGGTPRATFTNAQGLTTKLWEYRTPKPTGDEKDADVTTYEYDHADRMRRVRDHTGHEWSFEYDLRGRQTVAVDPDTGRTSTTYDDFDRVASVTAAGRTLDYEYDLLGRPASVKQGDTPLLGWTYDAGIPNGKGRAHTATRYVGGNAYASEVLGYDVAGRPLETKISIPRSEGRLAGDYVSKATYEADGAVGSVTYPAAGDLPEEKVETYYNTLGQPLILRGSRNTYVGETIYSPFGEPLQRGLLTTQASEMTWQTYEYEEGTRRLSSVAIDREKTPDADSKVSYAYDPTGNILKIAENAARGGREAQCFRYDHQRRVKDVWAQATTDCAGEPSDKVLGGPAPYWQSFDYDAAGNRVAQIDHGVAGGATVAKTFRPFGAGKFPAHAVDKAETTVQARGSRSVTGDEYAYDQAGRMTRRKLGDTVDQKLTWDAEGHVERITHKDGRSTSFVYDAEGNRLVKRDETDQSATLYLGNQELRVDLRNPDPTRQTAAGTRYYSHGGQTVAVRTSGGLSWLTGGQNGTSEIAVDSVSQQVVRQRTKPFGEPRGADTPLPGSRGFVGGTVDRSLNLVHLGAREYDPASGRFISPDPVMDFSDPQQLNAYGYGRNNPLSFADPSGMFWGRWNWNLVGHGVLDVVGMIPGPVGMVANGINAGWYAAQGDWTNAAMSAAGMIPGGKFLAKGAMALKNTVRTADTAKDVAKAAGNAKDATKAARQLTPPSAAKPKPAPKPEAPARPKQSAASAKSADGGGKASPKRGADAEGKPDSAPSRGSGGDKCHSFDPATKVAMGDGSTKAIGEVQVGDEVLATDPESRQSSVEKVTSTFTNQDQALTDVTVVDGRGRDEVLRTTQNHPFWSETRGAWVDAGELRAGERLRSDGEPVRVAKTVSYRGNAEMNDLTVATFHTYHVLAGNTPILVHNCGDDIPENEGDHFYRGVDEQHRDFATSHAGDVTPVGGNSNWMQHNDGSVDSAFTSWTSSRAVAESHASKMSGRGIVLMMRRGTRPIIDMRAMGLDKFGESEVLVEGAVKGLKHYHYVRLPQ
ncbi:hypothetical protein GCM10010124_18810 [Pilimelia terevasa]|uniref:Hint domain-containing protein n=1 Tax=Pilimelia terevasa TaxID=53372 RepID=A0A8J3BJX8_9ACTN|nr:polymorphic toxin-type HINT domain-containing protein [Pilimelia terevasa]GGK26412.1 hypothetical protein GCM10010124_18810 [Pilimelia terevasa]